MPSMTTRLPPKHVLTNTPRAGESAEQTAARTAPRGTESHSKIEAKAKLFYALRGPDGRLFVNIQTHEGLFVQIELTRGQLANLVIDGVKFLVEGRA